MAKLAHHIHVDKVAELRKHLGTHVRVYYAKSDTTVNLGGIMTDADALGIFIGKPPKSDPSYHIDHNNWLLFNRAPGTVADGKPGGGIVYITIHETGTVLYENHELALWAERKDSAKPSQ